MIMNNERFTLPCLLFCYAAQVSNGAHGPPVLVLIKSSSNMELMNLFSLELMLLNFQISPQFFKMMIICLWCYLTCILMKYRSNLNYDNG